MNLGQKMPLGLLSSRIQVLLAGRWEVRPMAAAEGGTQVTANVSNVYCQK
jgi:hypothetical protein